MKRCDYWMVMTTTTINRFWDYGKVREFCRMLENAHLGYEVYQKVCKYASGRYVEGEL